MPVLVPLGNTHLPPQFFRIDSEIPSGVRAEAFTGEALTWVAHEPLPGADEADEPAASQIDAQPESRARCAGSRHDRPEHDGSDRRRRCSFPRNELHQGRPRA